MPIPHVLSTNNLSDAGIHALLRESKSLVHELGFRHDRTEFLAGRNVVLTFFEPSTRTRMSFETAAHRLGAATVVFQSSGSSVEKGESFAQTMETISAMKFDAIVLRHAENGVHEKVASMVDVPVISAGEGTQEHPTQALLDFSTLLSVRESVKDCKVCLVGDIRHSRVARSQVLLGKRLGVRFGVCVPEGFHAEEFEDFEQFSSIEEAIQWADVLSMLRIQRERIVETTIPELSAYRQRYALTTELANRYPDVLIIHPGPINEGVEIDADVVGLPQCLINRQVTHGVAVRMALLELVMLNHPHHFIF